MPPKKKEEVIDLASLPPWLALAVFLSCECSEENAAHVSKAVYENNFTIKKQITRSEIIEYGKQNGLYIDPTQDTKKKPDKNAAEIPTELTPELLAKIFIKFYEEINLEGRKDKKLRLDAIAEGKDPATIKKDTKKTDAKDKKDTKKPGGKDAKKGEEEEQKEEPPLDSIMKKDCDFVYFLVDYPTTKAEISELSKQGFGLDLVLRLKEKVIEHKSFEESELLGKKEDDDSSRNRLDKFLAASGTPDQTTDEDAKAHKAQIDEVKKAKDQEFINRYIDIVNAFKAARLDSIPTENVRNTYIKDIICEFDEEIPIEETLRNIVYQIYEEICNFSGDVVAYKEWLQKRKTQPVKQPAKINLEAVKSQLEVPPVEEPGKSPAKAGAPGKTSPQMRPSSKETAKKDEKKKSISASKQALEEPKKEETIKVEPPKPEEKEPEFTFNFYEKQLNPIKEEHLTAGALLEAVVDEISHTARNVKTKQDLTSDDIENVFRSYSADMLRTLTNIKPPTQEAVINTIDMSNPYHYIINEADLIAYKSQDDHLSTQEPLGYREHLTFDKLKLPGLDRHEMPPHPEKSEPIRKAEKSQIHPFLSFEVTDYERFQSIELHEKLFQDKAPREWNFGDRVYEERFNSNVLRQKLYQALLFDPETFTQYYDKDDSLLVGIYFVNPPGRIIRKKWTSPWKVLPNIENWVLHFKDNENNFNNNSFYNIDYQLVENLHEVIKFMYPSDNSVIMCSQFNVGEASHNFYRILKENFICGIRKSIKADNPYSELWALFENRTKLLVEVERLDKGSEGRSDKEGPEKIEEVEANLEEGHTEREHQVEASGQHGTQCNCEICARNRPMTAPQAAVYGATFTLTLENGLIVKFLTNGDILQTIARSKKQKEGRYFDEISKEQHTKEDFSEQEKTRLITGKGSVIRYMKDGSTQILYANGNYAFNKKNSGTWITTNNKGLRKGRRIKDNSEFELDPIPSAKKTDPETGCKILIREDKVMVIQYPDGRIYTTHKDGTKFLTSADSNHIIIEHNDFATVKITYDPVKARMGTIVARGSSSSYQGFENIMERSFDGRVTETFMPDGSKVVGYKEKRELEGYENYEISNIHLLYEPEGSVFRFKSDGEVILISANDRYELNEKGENKEENDIDYFLQLYGIPTERKSGVYTAELIKNEIWTRDSEGNYFSISSSGETKGKILVSFDLNQNVNEADKPPFQEIPDGLYVEHENNFLPPPEKVLPPKLFIIKNDNTGSEYLNDSQLKHYFRIKEKDPNCNKIVEDQVPGFHNCQSITFLTSFSNYDKDKMKHIFVKIPNNVDIIPQTETIRDEPLQLKFLYRNLLRFTELDEVNRQKLHEDLSKFVEWKKNQTKEANEFGIKDRSDDHKEKEYGIQQKIIESRRTTHHQENYEDCFSKIGQRDFPTIFEEFSKRLLDSRKRKESEHVVVKTRKSITKHYLPLEEPPVPPEEIYPLGIRFSEVDWRNTDFVGSYYQTYPGMQFEKTLPKYDVKTILEQKEKLRKTQNLMRDDETLKEGAQQYSLPRPNPERASVSPVKTEKEKTYTSPKIMRSTLSPSWNKTRDFQKKEREDRDTREAADYHRSKSPHFDLYGEERKNKETVPTLLRPVAQRELNTKYITVESATERQVKTISMANRLHIHAPSTEDIRKMGSHTFSKMSLDKKYDRESLMEKNDLAVTSAFADPRKRDLLVIPVTVSFGKIQCGAAYERIVKVKNEDVLPQRIQVRQPHLSHVTVRQKETGPMAMGMTRELIVTAKAEKANLGPINCEFEIISKHDVYKIPITGEIVPEGGAEFDKSKMKTKLSPLNESIGSVRKHDLSGEVSAGDQSFPSFKYDRNTKLDMELHNKKKQTDSYQSDI